MTRSLWSATPARQISQQSCRRFISTSRPAAHLSAFSVGQIASCRKRVVASAPLSRPSIPRFLISCSRLHAPVASFSSSSVRPATKVTQNPRAGEDGETLMINISPRAIEVGQQEPLPVLNSSVLLREWEAASFLLAVRRLRDITDPSTSPSATKEENPYHHLRITVTSGGCHGFQYMMSLESASKIDAEEDTIFEGEAESATTDIAGEAKVVMDEPSLELLSGSTVDYTTELIGSQFTIVDNPRATSNCGCGTSFDVMD
ncbi:hypothetical protein N7454_010847 [Penicillium verhagenii]|nr:hypothetical protein N7454_010847 [Penicillium verhagenii]